MGAGPPFTVLISSSEYETSGAPFFADIVKGGSGSVDIVERTVSSAAKAARLGEG